MLRILTLNLNYRVARHGAWAQRRVLIAETAARASADVLVLQAVEGGSGGHQARELAALLGFDHGPRLSDHLGLVVTLDDSAR